MKKRDEFCIALSKTFKEYKNYGARSNRKLKPIHHWIGSEIKKRLGSDYSVLWLDNPKEYTAEGKYMPKRVDIAVLKDNKPKVMISFKFVTSNYSQNNVNYFENLIGECANLKMAGIHFVHVFILRDKIPYLKKNGIVEHIEKVTDKNLSKYIKLAKDFQMKHAPDAMAIVIVSIENGNVSYSDLDGLDLSQESKDFLNNATIDNLIESVVRLAQQ